MSGWLVHIIAGSGLGRQLLGIVKQVVMEFVVEAVRQEQEQEQEHGHGGGIRPAMGRPVGAGAGQAPTGRGSQAQGGASGPVVMTFQLPARPPPLGPAPRPLKPRRPRRCATSLTR